eukprot:gb/GECG01001671.1/.p1 GENE.gb/GECG01001671.1/~~gb/GECG01001671.1/.p1  ORF type:complete len:193 (+),score=19.36 gb/GECG01001671.1/:1-579(+)
MLYIYRKVIIVTQKPKYYDKILTLRWEGKDLTVYLRKRPFCDRFLSRLSKKFDISVFTASHQPYADQVIDYLDPFSCMIRRRYYRDSCKREESTGHLIKDLDSLNVDVHRTIMIDDTPKYFRRHPDNGLFCLPFEGSNWDKELLHLEAFLMQLDDNSEDIRPALKLWQANKADRMKQIEPSLPVMECPQDYN